MQKPVFRVKRYAHAKYKFVARAKVNGKWKRRYFKNESEALAFAREHAQAEKYFDSPAVQSDDDTAIGTLAPVVERSPRGSDSGSDLSDLVTPTYLGPRLQRYFGGDWCMHLPFGYDLIRELRPRIFVQLGVGNGESYFAFCQSVAEHILSTKCYGIDTWRGAGSVEQVDREIFAEVANHNWRYSTFSEIREMTFTEALPEFADGSVDLLHIDGAHTYEDAKRDFESWLPKLFAQGIILFHGIIQGEGDSGVERLWKEIARPKTSFLFEFGHGLGVWKKPGLSKRRTALVRGLFTASEAEKKRINDHYTSAAAALALWHAAREGAIAAPLSIQIFADQGRGFDESISMTAQLVADRRQTIRFDHIEKLLCVSASRLRIDPVDRPALVNISSIKIIGDSTEKVLYSAHSADDFRRIDVSPGLLRHNEDGNLLLVATDTDPQIFLPALRLTESCRLEIVLEPHLAPDSVLMHPKQALDAAAEKTTGELTVALDARQAELGHQMKTLQEGATTVPGKTVYLKVFHPLPGGYRAIESWPNHFATRSWRTLAMDLPARKGESDLPTRIDPVTFPAIIEIAEMVLKRSGSDETVWAARTQKEFDELKIAGTAFRLPHPKHLRLLSFGSDPQLLLPSFTIEMNDEPLRLEICLLVDSDPAAVRESLAALKTQPRQPAPEATVLYLALSAGEANGQGDGLSLQAPIRMDETQIIRFENIESLSPAPDRRLRIKALYHPARLKISRIVITQDSSGFVLYRAESADEFEEIEVSAGAVKRIVDGGFTVDANNAEQHMDLPAFDLPANGGYRLEIEIEPHSAPSILPHLAETIHSNTAEVATHRDLAVSDSVMR
jgi:hypothetical protein